MVPFDCWINKGFESSHQIHERVEPVPRSIICRFPPSISKHKLYIWDNSIVGYLWEHHRQWSIIWYLYGSFWDDLIDRGVWIFCFLTQRFDDFSNFCNGSSFPWSLIGIKRVSASDAFFSTPVTIFSILFSFLSSSFFNNAQNTFIGFQHCLRPLKVE